MTHAQPDPSNLPRPESRSQVASDATSPQSGNLVLAGVGVAIAGILLIVFSCLSWATDKDGVVSVTGLGSASADDSRVTEHDLSMFEESTHATGIWTIVFGALLLIAAAALIFRIYQPMAGIFAGLVGLAAFITTVVFFADPTGVLPDELTNAGDVEVTRGLGLWLVFIGGIIALVAGGLAFVLGAFGDKFGRAAQAR